MAYPPISYTLSPHNDAFDITHPPPNMFWKAERCSDLNNTCLFTLVSFVHTPYRDNFVEWKYNIDLTKMEGTNKKLLSIHMKAMGVPENALGEWYQRLTLDLDGQKVTGYPKAIQDADRAWAENNFSPNLSLDGKQILAIVITQGGEIWSGGVGLHCAEIVIQMSYCPNVEPPKCKVRINVKDEQFYNVSGAYVRLMMGEQAMKYGYTDGGFIEFINVYQADYALRIGKSGYYDYETALSVYPPLTDFTATLIVMPSPPAPNWASIALWLGAICIGGLIIYKVIIPRIPPLPTIIKIGKERAGKAAKGIKRWTIGEEEEE